MALTMKQKKAVTKEVAKRYQKATKKEKGTMGHLGDVVNLLTY